MLYPGSPGTFMSESEVAELRVLVRELQLQVERLSLSVRNLEAERRPVSEAATSNRWDRISTPPRSTRSHQSPTGTPSSGYNSLAQEIPSCPDFCYRIAASLRGSDIDNRARALRAWEIGYWARFVLSGQIAKPRPSPPAISGLSNTIYVVLRAPGWECPLICNRGADYRHVVGQFTDQTLSHGFASLAEAKIYCHGAGVEFPERRYQWNA